MASLGNWAWRPGEATIACSDELRNVLQLDPVSEIHLAEFVGCFSSSSQSRFRRQLDAIVQGGGEGEVACDFKLAGEDERHGVLRIRASMEGASSSCRILGTLQDITERYRAESQIRRLAYTDPVTSLPNRASFMQQLGDELSRAVPGNDSVALLYVGVDDFKRVNDTLGSSTGDHLLHAVGQRLVQSMRGSTASLSAEGQETTKSVSRLGGDEFALIVVDHEAPVDVEAIARRLVQNLAVPISIDDHNVHLTASVGTATYPGDGEDVEKLLKCASTAMRYVKNEGKNGFSRFRTAMDEGEMRRAEVGSDLRGALSRNELQLHYQAQVDVESATVDGVEALLRWQSGRLGAVSPAEFIPAAESTRLIIPIGSWVLRTACEQLARWDSEGLEIPRVAVNVSLVQFVQADFPDTVRAALESSGIRPDRLELEITESVLAGDVELATRILAELKEIGVQLSIDDFGTGYSSLAYLKTFPVDRLKIDRCFVRDIASEPDDAAIAEAVLAMAGSMGLRVIAEGVETSAQLGMRNRRTRRAFRRFWKASSFRLMNR
jgi:diguanylate cyclase (GGDEF)-like protein